VNAYIACALTHVPRESFARYVAFVHALAKVVTSAGCKHASYALIDSDPQLAEKPFAERARLCYLWDRDLLRQSNLVIAEVTYPSIGMGIELEIASSMGIPVIMCYQRAAKNQVEPAEYENPDHSRHRLQVGEGYVSLMALGLPTLFQVIGYTSDEEAFADVADAIKILSKGDARL
jgi:hypothetical protein